MSLQAHSTRARSVLKIDEQELLKRLEEIEKWGNEGV